MPNSHKKDPQAISINKISIIGITIVALAILLFLSITTSAMFRLNQQIKLSTEHPFVVSRKVGEIRADVTQMRIFSERLQYYNSVSDIEFVNSSLTEIYLQIQQPLADVKRLYLGPKTDIDTLSDSIEQVIIYQKKLLAFAGEPGRTTEEITAFQKRYLYPLYSSVENESLTILSHSQNLQMSIYDSADALWKTTLAWSLVIVLLSLIGLALFQYIISKLSRALSYRTQQFDTLSHTIDETFLIFEEDEPAYDFVAYSSMRVLGIPSDNLQKSRQLFYDCLDEEAARKVSEGLVGDWNDFPREMAIEFLNPDTNETRLLSARFYISGEGNTRKYIVTLADQTDAIHAQRALNDALVNAENANNAKRDFLSRMSHEIRTPMNAIIGMTTIAAANIEDRSKIEDCLSKISYSSKHLLMLINDVLDMSRIDNNKLSITNEPFDICQFINSFISITYSQAESKGIKFTEKMINFVGDCVYLGDAMRINQVLLNLSSNALKFTPKGGYIHFSVKRIPSRIGKDCIRFIIEDTGIGMTEEALSRIYDPFQQADSTISQKYGGTGLGMPIAKNLVSLMGGFIDVKSKIGVGTTCTVEIPLERSGTVLEPLSAIGLTALNVLIIDDEQDMCEHTALLLHKINIHAQWVLSGTEAIKKLSIARDNGDDFDICFIDWKMPTMDGIETTRAIRQTIGPDKPIIIISSYDWSEIEQEARNAGANAFVSKPLFLSSVYNVLINVTNGAFARSSSKKADLTIPLDGKKILVAEDNDLNLEIMSEMLKMSGAIVTTATNGKEASDIFLNSASGDFDAILMDVQMPIMDGYEATHLIRYSNHPSANIIPIIATTANAFTEDVAAVIAAGMNAHVSKPIDMKNLCTVLLQFIPPNTGELHLSQVPFTEGDVVRKRQGEQ